MFVTDSLHMYCNKLWVWVGGCLGEGEGAGSVGKTGTFYLRNTRLGLISVKTGKKNK